MKERKFGGFWWGLALVSCFWGPPKQKYHKNVVLRVVRVRTSPPFPPTPSLICEMKRGTAVCTYNLLPTCLFSSCFPPLKRSSPRTRCWRALETLRLSAMTTALASGSSPSCRWMIAVGCPGLEATRTFWRRFAWSLMRGENGRITSFTRYYLKSTVIVSL